MDRIIDAAAVILFAGATAIAALYARSFFAHDTQDAREEPAVTARTEPRAARVAHALPRLEAHVAAGSMRDRTAVCDGGERLADIDSIEHAIASAPDDGDPALDAMLADGMRALRACVACKPEPTGCAAAARAFAKIEDRLALPRGAGGI